MPSLDKFSQRRTSLRSLQVVRAVPGHDPAPAAEWPLVMTDAGVEIVCPRCGKGLTVRTVGQAWAAAKSHNERQAP